MLLKLRKNRSCPIADCLQASIPRPKLFLKYPASVPGRPVVLPTVENFYAQVAATPSPTPTPSWPERRQPEYWLPRPMFIPCTLLNTVESSHINTPVVGEVTRDCYQNGHLIVPAGTIVCFPLPETVRSVIGSRLRVCGFRLCRRPATGRSRLRLRPRGGSV